MYDPIKLSDVVRNFTVRGLFRKYYRVARGGRWYGGCAAADCVGCNLKCIFCWSGAPRDYPDRIGKFYSPEEVFLKLDQTASRRSYRYIRISGNEPTIGREHLLKVLELNDQHNKYVFILETNGILIGYDKSYAKDLSRFRNIHVRVSLKGCTKEEFAKLTGAYPEAFNYQINALRNLLDYSVKCHPAVMLSFSDEENIKQLKRELMEMDEELVREFEEEYVFEYPHVVERLRKAGLKPKISYNPKCIPEELI